MTQPKLNKSFIHPFRKTARDTNVSKAYLRNFGKGHIEYVDGTLKFCVEKGRVAKRKEIVKEIPLADVEAVDLEKNELTVIWKGNTERFVVENVSLAQLVAQKASALPRIREKPTEKQEVAFGQGELKFVINLSLVLSVVDSLFDVLRSLQGRVNWARTVYLVKRFEKGFKTLVDGEVALANINISLLSSAISEHDVVSVSKEGYRLLSSIYDVFQEDALAERSSVQLNENSLSLSITVQAYYVLNDILLASVVGDENVGDEVSHLAFLLGKFPKENGVVVNVDEVLGSVSTMLAEGGNESFAKEVRTIFKEQLNSDRQVVSNLD